MIICVLDPCMRHITATSNCLMVIVTLSALKQNTSLLINIKDETRSTLPGAPPLANSFQLYLKYEMWQMVLVLDGQV